MSGEKTLFIGRHAKSSWDYPGRSDIDRPLAERGVQNAYDMASRMKKRDEVPQLIISSPANRALHTAVIYSRVLDYNLGGIVINEDLYMGGEDAILQVISLVDDNIDSLMIFGHNPDFTYLANNFLNDRIYNIPTCGVVRLSFKVTHWENIHRSTLTGHLFDYPKKN